MTPELMQEYKKELLQNIQAEMNDEGSLTPFVQIIGEKEGLDKPVIIHIVTEFSDSESKDFFIEEVIPEISRKLKKNYITPHHVVFVSEVWVTSPDKKTDDKKKEAVFIAYSSKEGEIMETYDIIRHAYEVDDKGELSSKVDLVKNEDLSSDASTSSKGRFSDLYSTLMKQFNK